MIESNIPKILDTPEKQKEWIRTAEEIRQCKISISYYKQDRKKISAIIQKKETELKKLQQHRKDMAKYGLPRMKQHIGYLRLEERDD